ncbi:hypothetical protein RNJ44_03184 [Nakaseomyces bracarensis]|uniref:Uncharacterized protein n=1 Tax=Nakaseomyces bracarensis TaxID=273131 RepID=A0ABR4NZ71_9SACH
MKTPLLLYLFSFFFFDILCFLNSFLSLFEFFCHHKICPPTSNSRGHRFE